MAKVKNNIVTQGRSGTLGGQLVFRQTSRGTVVSVAPRTPSGPPTAGSPKQLIACKAFTDEKGQRYQDSEYGRHGVAELFVANEPLRGWREMRVEEDHKATTWVQFVARLMDTTYRTAKKVR